MVGRELWGKLMDDCYDEDWSSFTEEDLDWKAKPDDISEEQWKEFLQYLDSEQCQLDLAETSQKAFDEATAEDFWRWIREDWEPHG